MGTVSIRLVQILIGLVLARVLLPDDFGAIAIVLVFTSILGVVVDAAVTQPIVQRRTEDLETLSGAFRLALVLGLVLFLALVAAAEGVAWIYAHPDLGSLIKITGVLVLCEAAATVPKALLMQRLDFQSIAMADVAAVSLGGVTALALALIGVGVWSLAAQQLVGATVRTGVMWRKADWRPSNHGSTIRTAGSFRSYAVPMIGAGFLNAVFSNLYSIVIGRAFGMGELGLYNRALVLQQLPARSLTDAVGRVMFPHFASCRKDTMRLKAEVRESIQLLMVIVAPVCLGVASIAETLVQVVLNDRWLGMVPLLWMLGVIGITYPLHVVNLTLLRSLGHSDRFLRLELIKQALTLGNIAVTWQFGLSAMVFGQMVVSLTAFWINSTFSRQLIGYQRTAQLTDAAPYILMASVMSGAVLGLESLPIVDPVKLPLMIASGIFTYWLMCRFFRPKGWENLKSLIRPTSR
ncbi:MAG: lipopolysaccharide biosynthesis protein [Pseudomonadales bacterium]